MLIRSYKFVTHSVLLSQNSEIPFPALFVDNSSLFQAIQVALVIRGLFIFELAYFYLQKWSKKTTDFLSANSRLAVQNDGTYLPRITRETCTNKVLAKGVA
jgi:hypothetical protein